MSPEVKRASRLALVEHSVSYVLRFRHARGKDTVRRGRIRPDAGRAERRTKLLAAKPLLRLETAEKVDMNAPLPAANFCQSASGGAIYTDVDCGGPICGSGARCSLASDLRISYHCLRVRRRLVPGPSCGPPAVDPTESRLFGRGVQAGSCVARRVLNSYLSIAIAAADPSVLTTTP